VVDSAIVVPVSQPVHKVDARATGSQRLEMLRLAYADDERVQVSDIEVCRQQPSYTVLTLRELREADPGAHLCFVLGADWSAGVDGWYQGSELPLLAHLIVLNRPGLSQASASYTSYNGFTQAHDIDELHVQQAGLSYEFDGPEMDISSTEVREALIRRGATSGEETISKDEQWLGNALPASVLHYIKSNGLYR